MNFFFGRILLFIITSGLFLCSCKNRNKAVETGVESELTDGGREQWLKHYEFPTWTTTSSPGSQLLPLNGEAANNWLRWVMPLPKLIRLESKLTLPATSIKINLRSNATDMEQFAENELKSLIIEKTGAKSLNGSFEISVGICDEQGKVDGVYIPGAEKLSGLKNKDQAYVIAPLSTSGLVVVGLTGKGVYYGVKTLEQLMKPGLKPNTVVAPILYVMDWPDLSERGLWGGWEQDSALMRTTVQYMSDRKMNLIETTGPVGYLAFDGNNRGIIKIKPEGRNQARLHAMNYVLIITHIDIFGIISDIYKHYPKAKGKGAGAVSNDLSVPCASSPEFIQVLTDWFESAANQGYFDVNIWLTEHGDLHCGCEKCKHFSQYVLEAKACAKAWQIAHDKYPKLGLRILLTQGTYKVNDQIIAAVPQQIKITYYSGSWENGTYTALKEPIIYPLLNNYSKERHTLGCYPTLSASCTYILPWSGPEYIKYRMAEFVDKGLTGFTGYVAYSKNNNNFYDFNIAASSEWAWNVNGRSEHEFAAAWATQNGSRDPEIFADWAVMMGPVSWDVYGSQVPHVWWSRKQTMSMFKKGQEATLGKGMFQYFPTVQHLDDDLAICENALHLAEKAGDKAIITETQTLRGYLKMIKAIHSLTELAAGKRSLDNNQTRSLQASFKELQLAEVETTEALNAWYHTIDPGFNISLSNAVGVTHQVVFDIADSLKRFGIKI